MCHDNTPMLLNMEVGMQASVLKIVIAIFNPTHLDNTEKHNLCVCIYTITNSSGWSHAHAYKHSKLRIWDTHLLQDIYAIIHVPNHY